MKQKLICMAATAAMAMAMAPVAPAAEDDVQNVNYVLNDNSVEVNEESGRKTVIITNENGEIVYLNQVSGGFGNTEILDLKEDIPDGKYTIKLGADSGTTIAKTFYIGFMETGGIDVKLYKPDQNSTTTNADNTMNIGYMKSGITGSYNSLIIKKDSKYYGIEFNPVMTLDNAAVGIQFNGVADENEISEVWISSRGVETNTTSTAAVE